MTKKKTDNFFMLCTFKVNIYNFYGNKGVVLYKKIYFSNKFKQLTK